MLEFSGVKIERQQSFATTVKLPKFFPNLSIPLSGTPTSVNRSCKPTESHQKYVNNFRTDPGKCSILFMASKLLQNLIKKKAFKKVYDHTYFGFSIVAHGKFREASLEKPVQSAANIKDFAREFNLCLSEANGMPADGLKLKFPHWRKLSWRI